MPRPLTSPSSLDNLKRIAKRWLRDLRANVADARARLDRALPNALALPRSAMCSTQSQLIHHPRDRVPIVSCIGTVRMCYCQTPPLSSSLSE